MDRLGWPNVRADAHGRRWGFCVAVLLLLVCFMTTVTSDIQRTVWLRQYYLHTQPAARNHLVLLEHLPRHYRNSDLLTKIYRAKFRPSFVRADVVPGSIHRPWRHSLAHFTSHGALPGASGVTKILTSLSLLRKGELGNPESTRQTRQQKLTTGQPRAAAILEFRSSAAAWQAAHSVHCPRAGRMVPYFLGTSIDNVRCDNLGLSWQSKLICRSMGNLIGFSSIMVWGVLVAWTGMLSQLDALAQLLGWTNTIQAIPDSVIGMLQGVAPSIVLALLVALYPSVLDLIISWQRLPTLVVIELTVQRLYFGFLFVHVIFTVSVSASMTAVLAEVAVSTSNIAVVLADNLPRASNYFLSYVTAQALLSSALICLQPWTWLELLVRKLKKRLPILQFKRDVEKDDRLVKQLQWGYIYPIPTVLACAGKDGHSVCARDIVCADQLSIDIRALSSAHSASGCSSFRVAPLGLLLRHFVHRQHTCRNGRTSIPSSGLAIICRDLYRSVLLHRFICTEFYRDKVSS